jgi:hypothetical protein
MKEKERTKKKNTKGFQEFFIKISFFDFFKEILQN